MSQHLINYFEEFPKLIQSISDKSEEKKIEVLKPLIKDSSELFYRTDQVVDRDKLVYVFLDGSCTHRVTNYTEDWRNNLPVPYIGMGSLTRPLDHITKDIEKVNFRFREWLDFMYKIKSPVYIMIYAMSMTDEEAKELEADLINLTMKKQSPLTGVGAYRSSKRPVTLFNAKHETSNQRVYSVHGLRHKKF